MAAGDSQLSPGRRRSARPPPRAGLLVARTGPSVAAGAMGEEVPVRALRPYAPCHRPGARLSGSIIRLSQARRAVCEHHAALPDRHLPPRAPARTARVYRKTGSGFVPADSARRNHCYESWLAELPRPAGLAATRVTHPHVPPTSSCCSRCSCMRAAWWVVGRAISLPRLPPFCSLYPCCPLLR
eukprot:COSAG06_NODE_852_length_11954_cov_6.453986_8_plen_184_part_00